jgi:hypothetical protein
MKLNAEKPCLTNPCRRSAKNAGVRGAKTLSRPLIKRFAGGNEPASRDAYCSASPSGAKFDPAANRAVREATEFENPERESQECETATPLLPDG